MTVPLDPLTILPLSKEEPVVPVVCVLDLGKGAHAKEMAMRKHSLFRIAFWRYNSCSLYLTHLNSTIPWFYYSHRVVHPSLQLLLDYFITPQGFSGE